MEFVVPWRKLVRMPRFVAVISLLAVLAVSLSSQDLGTSVGSALSSTTAAVLFRHLKEPNGNMGVEPSKLNFRRISVNERALNIVVFRNGTSSQAEITSAEVQSSSFRLCSSVTFPFLIPPQTEAVLTIEFAPSRPGKTNGKMEIIYSARGDKKTWKSRIELQGEGVHK